jgi:hypothetical protein
MFNQVHQPVCICICCLVRHVGVHTLTKSDKKLTLLESLRMLLAGRRAHVDFITGGLQLQIGARTDLQSTKITGIQNI